MSLTDAQATLLAGSAVRAAVLLLIERTGPPARLWFGAGDYIVAPDTIDTTGGTYAGLGDLVGIPQLNQLINGVADRLEFALLGVNPEILSLVDGDAESLRGAPVHIGAVFLDGDFQPMFGPLWLWEGEADTPKISRQGTAGAAGVPSVTRVVSLSVGSAMTGRRRPKLQFFTDTEQRRRSPTDAFCDRVNNYSQDSTVKWP